LPFGCNKTQKKSRRRLSLSGARRRPTKRSRRGGLKNQKVFFQALVCLSGIDGQTDDDEIEYYINLPEKPKK
jgi:hypothetical protein